MKTFLCKNVLNLKSAYSKENKKEFILFFDNGEIKSLHLDEYQNEYKKSPETVGYADLYFISDNGLPEYFYDEKIWNPSDKKWMGLKIVDFNEVNTINSFIKTHQYFKLHWGKDLVDTKHRPFAINSDEEIKYWDDMWFFKKNDLALEKEKDLDIFINREIITSPRLDFIENQETTYLVFEDKNNYHEITETAFMAEFDRIPVPIGAYAKYHINSSNIPNSLFDFVNDNEGLILCKHKEEWKWLNKKLTLIQKDLENSISIFERQHIFTKEIDPELLSCFSPFFTQDGRDKNGMSIISKQNFAARFENIELKINGKHHWIELNNFDEDDFEMVMFDILKNFIQKEKPYDWDGKSLPLILHEKRNLPFAIEFKGSEKDFKRLQKIIELAKRHTLKEIRDNIQELRSKHDKLKSFLGLFGAR